MVDIIIPVYNSLDTLGRTLDSIMMQTYFEIVDIYIIDDCSNCSYGDLLDKYSELKIHYHRMGVNSGPGLAREEGMRISNNKYIIFIDSDDYFLKDFSLEFLYNEINMNDLDYVNAMDYNERLKASCYNANDLHSKIYRRKFLIDNDIHFNDTRYHEDNLFNNMVLACNPRLKYLDFVLYHYSYNKKSLTNNDEYDEFEKIEVLLSNIRVFLDETKKRKCNRDRVLRLFAYKIIYLNRLIRKYNDYQIEQIKEWFDKYEINARKYLEINDRNFIIDDILKTYDY